MASFHVGIIGGGIGGLCLAQGLKKAGVHVTLFERDRTRSDRLQGYRIHIDPSGSGALKACLPAELYALFVATCGKSNGGFRVLTEQLDELIRFNVESDPERVDSHKSVSRITLREVLLGGLEDIVEFDKTFTRFERRASGKIAAFFEDGSSSEFDVLVGADGGNSRLRKQFLPHAQRIDTGVRGIAGKVALTEQHRRELNPKLLASPALVLAPQPFSLFIAKQEFRRRPNRGGDRIGGVAGSSLPPGLLFDDTQDYVMWAFGGRWTTLGLPDESSYPSGGGLETIVLDRIAKWHPDFRRLVELSDPATLSLFPIRTAVAVAPWATRCVTVIGDAIHSMTPYRGIGANIALRDASLLCRNLELAQAGHLSVIEAIHRYETAMIRYGFKAVRASLEAMEQAVSEKRMGFVVQKAGLRVLNALPPLKRWALARRSGD